MDRPRTILAVLARLVVLAGILIALFVGIGYAAGWVTFDHQKDQEKATIEIDTGAVEDDVNELKHEVDHLVDRARNAIEDEVEDNEEQPVSPPDANERREINERQDARIDN